MVEVVLRRTRRMVGVRVVKPEQLRAQFARPPFRRAVIIWRDPKPCPWPLVGHVGQRQGLGNCAVAADQRTAAFVRIRLRTVRANSGVHLCVQSQRHPYRGPPPSPLRGFGEPSWSAPLTSGSSSQNRSDRYFSPPSGKTTTTTASGERRATLRAAARLAPLEMPTNSPVRASCRVSSNASSVATPISSSASDRS